MTINDFAVLKEMFTTQLNDIKTAAAEARQESREDHRQVKDSIARVDEKVDELRERTARLEANDERRLKSLDNIKWAIGALFAGIPVLFFIFDRITH